MQYIYGNSGYSQQQHQPVQALVPSSPLDSSPHHHHHHHHHAHLTAAVPFGVTPGSQPGVLGWGVGMSAANGAGFGFGAASSSSHHSHSGLHRSAAAAQPLGWGAAAASSSSSSGNGNANGSVASRPASPSTPAPSSSRRRRRSPSPDPGRDESGADDEHMPARKIRPLYSANSKRARVATPVANDPFAASSAGQAVVGDLGKALASLDKPALLDVFSRLLSTQPALAPLISTLLPSPSLATVLSTLNSLERAITAAMPTGAFVRPEYVWSRVRVPVEDFVTEARRFLGLFVPAQAPSVGHTVTEEDLSHPSTCFEFLEALTRILLRLETALPAVPASVSSTPLASHLLPLTFNAWHTFLTRLSNAVQSHGKVLPNSLVQAWFDRLDSLAAESVRESVFSSGGPNSAQTAVVAAAQSLSAGGSAVRKAMEGVRDRAKKELGWLVGLRNVDGPGASTGMEGVEQDDEEL